MEMKQQQLQVFIDDELMQTLQQNHILREDVEAAITACEQTGKRFADPFTGHLIGQLRIGQMTVWVEYGPDGTGFTLYKAYGQGLKLEDEPC